MANFFFDAELFAVAYRNVPGARFSRERTCSVAPVTMLINQITIGPIWQQNPSESCYPVSRGGRTDGRRPVDDGGADEGGGPVDRTRMTCPSMATSTPSARQRRPRRSRSTIGCTRRPPVGLGSTKSSAVWRRVRSISRTLASSTQRKPRAATNEPRPTTTLACAMSRERLSGIGATASMRDLTISASTPAASARATLGGVRIRSI